MRRILRRFFLRFVNPKELAQTALEQTALELPAQTTDCLSGGARETSFASFCLNYLRFLGVFETDFFASEFIAATKPLRTLNFNYLIATFELSCH